MVEFLCVNEREKFFKKIFFWENSYINVFHVYVRTHGRYPQSGSSREVLQKIYYKKNLKETYFLTNTFQVKLDKRLKTDNEMWNAYPFKNEMKERKKEKKNV